ncbi:MAG: AcrR family transcriptional regulator [Paraglaciecola psychrophila]
MTFSCYDISSLNASINHREPPLPTTTSRRRRSDKGENTAQSILLAAEQWLIEQGYHNFSLRKVAAAAEVTLGNLQYYYPSKDALIKAMLDNAITRYLIVFDRIRQSAGDDPKEQLKGLVSEIMHDLTTYRTTVFFPELWSLSNHDDHATEFLDAMYEQYRQVLVEVISLINPTLSVQQLKRLAVFISASMEGHTVFIGHGKPWTQETDNIISMASQSFLWLVESGTIPE